MAKIRREDIERGAAAELAFQAWLDASRLPYIYVDQARETVPAHFRGGLKRPDYFVAVPRIGMLALDVKSKSVYRGGFLFDDAEIQKLAAFAEIFHVDTYFACLDPEGGPEAVWFRIFDLARRAPEIVNDKPVVRAPFSAGQRVDMRRPFLDALREALTL